MFGSVGAEALAEPLTASEHIELFAVLRGFVIVTPHDETVSESKAMNMLAILLTALGLGLGPQTGGAAQAVDGEGAVRAALEALRHAVLTCDIDAYARHWHEQGSIFIEEGAALRSASAYLDVWRQVCAKGGRITVDMKDEQVSVYGDVALVISISDWSFRPSADAKPASGRQRFTTVFRKTPEGWKIVHAHGSPLKTAGG